MKFESVESGADIRLNILVYGDSGVGKTTFIESGMDCQETSPVLAIDIDGGMVSVSGSKMKLVRPRSMAEIQDIYDYLRYENTKFRSVGIDTISEVQRKLSMGEILGILEDDFSYKNLDKAIPATQYDWLSSGEQMRRTIRAFRDLAYLPDPERRIHVIFTALERYEEKFTTVCPALPGKLGMEIGASVDILGRLSVKTVTKGDEEREAFYLHMRHMVDEEGVRYLGKARVPRGKVFPRGIYNPTVGKLIRYWIGAEAPEVAAEPKKSKRRPGKEDSTE